ncbi:poly(U)-specific endoribonuclease-C isoform X1 [Anabas testudineus]|uniref:poly(U)-specific endoribonuclease-C isoform X1 n=1 Tax=Anabas testudineus TaxID=64144 RepID=UPI000E45CF58|nr:poly(U)-specific endoribonuclease-C isoform X1 [Anabas testudineus]
MSAKFCGVLLFAVFVTGLNASRPAVNQELSNILNELWRLDVNRMKPGIDYTISIQGRANFVSQGSHAVRDHASQPLFSSVNENKLKNTTTFSRFMKLLDNYECSTGVTERVTTEELTETKLFLEAVLETEVMKAADGLLSLNTLLLVLEKKTIPNICLQLWNAALASAGSPERTTEIMWTTSC